MAHKEPIRLHQRLGENLPWVVASVANDGYPPWVVPAPAVDDIYAPALETTRCRLGRQRPVIPKTINVKEVFDWDR